MTQHDQPGEPSRRDQPAIELSLAIFLLASAGPALPMAGLFTGLLAMALALVKSAGNRAISNSRLTVLGSGLAWGLTGALLLSSVGQATVLLGLALVIAAALPVAGGAGHFRIFAAAVLAPAALVQLGSGDLRAIGLGGLMLVFALVVDQARRGLKLPVPAIEPELGGVDALQRELRAVRVRQSWRVIDGIADRAAAGSEQQQLDHQKAQRHI